MQNDANVACLHIHFENLLRTDLASMEHKPFRSQLVSWCANCWQCAPWPCGAASKLLWLARAW